ncbi:MAG: iron ABC transporter permease [Symploca sp. SIO3E6]|nr:iron ABC transporter permease [Caldora sp. SIO3E6]
MSTTGNNNTFLLCYLQIARQVAFHFINGYLLHSSLLPNSANHSIASDFSRIRRISTTSILAGTVTAFCGPIAFIGIAVPHLGRALLKTADHRLLIPAVMVLGANLAIAADLFAQLPGQQTTLPLNTVTSLLGVPIVLGVILRK